MKVKSHKGKESMSRVKETYYKRLEEELAFELGYMEYLRENEQAITEFDIKRMEQEYRKYSSPIKISNRIIANNQNYDNPKGA